MQREGLVPQSAGVDEGFRALKKFCDANGKGLPLDDVENVQILFDTVQAKLGEEGLKPSDIEGLRAALAQLYGILRDFEHLHARRNQLYGRAIKGEFDAMFRNKLTGVNSGVDSL